MKRFLGMAMALSWSLAAHTEGLSQQTKKQKDSAKIVNGEEVKYRWHFPAYYKYLLCLSPKEFCGKK